MRRPAAPCIRRSNVFFDLFSERKRAATLTNKLSPTKTSHFNQKREA